MSDVVGGKPEARFLSGWIWLLGALTALAPLSIDMYLPAFPAIEGGLSGAPGSVEFTLATYFIGMAIGQLFYGPLSDRFGRKPPLYIGLWLYLLASLACMLSSSVEQLAAWRFLQALGGCAGGVIARAIVRDRCGAHEAARVFSLLILVMGLAPILAPMLGGYLLALAGWRALFGVLAAFSALCLVCVYFGLRESHDISREPPLSLAGVLSNYAALFRNRGFVGYSLCGGLVMAGMFGYIAGSPFVLMQLGGLSPSQFAWVFGGNALGFVLVSQINARLLKWAAPTQILRRAVWLPAVVGTCLAGLALIDRLELHVLLPGLFLFVSSVGCINPNASAAALATHGQLAGTASALMGALQFGLAMVFGAAVSVWHDGTALPLSVVLGACGIGALLAHRFVLPHRARP